MYFPCSGDLLYKTRSYKYSKIHRKHLREILFLLSCRASACNFFFCEFYKDFQNIYFTEHLRATACVFYLFPKFWLKKAFWMILQFLKCKKNSKSSAHRYLKMSKLNQYYRHSEALWSHFERSAPDVNEHLAICDIS